MDSISDLLRQKALDIDIDAKKSDLDLIQIELDRLFNGQVKASQVTSKQDLIIKVTNSSLASEVRFKQIEIMRVVNQNTKTSIKKIIIRQ